MEQWAAWVRKSGAVHENQRPKFMKEMEYELDSGDTISVDECILGMPSNKYNILLRETMVSAVVIGESIFVHADLLPFVAEIFSYGISSLNEHVRMCLQDAESHIDCYQTTNNPLKVMVQGDFSVYWSRLWTTSVQYCSELEDLLTMLQLKRMIVGHNPYAPIDEHSWLTCQGSRVDVDWGLAWFDVYGEAMAPFNPTGILQITQISPPSPLLPSDDGKSPRLERTTSFRSEPQSANENSYGSMPPLVDRSAGASSGDGHSDGWSSEETPTRERLDVIYRKYQYYRDDKGRLLKKFQEKGMEEIDMFSVV